MGQVDQSPEGVMPLLGGNICKERGRVAPVFELGQCGFSFVFVTSLKSSELPSQIDDDIHQDHLLTQRTEEYFERSSQSDLSTSTNTSDRLLNMKITNSELRERCSKPCYAQARSMIANPNRVYLL